MNTDTLAPWPTMAAAELLHPVLVKDDPHTANPRAAVVEYYRAAAAELAAVEAARPGYHRIEPAEYQPIGRPFVYGPPAGIVFAEVTR